jgi:hypothetical protein
MVGWFACLPVGQLNGGVSDLSNPNLKDAPRPHHKGTKFTKKSVVFFVPCGAKIFAFLLGFHSL